VSADTIDENTEQAAELEPAEQDDDDAQAVQLHAPERGMLRIDPTQTELTDRQRAALAAKGWPLDRMTAAHIDAMMHLCQVRGLDPYSGDIVPMVTQDGIVNIITIAALRRLAQATGEHEGLTGKEWLDERGEGYEVWPKDLVRPYGARCGVYRRGQREATYAVVYTEEVQALERVDVVVRDRGKDITRHEWRLAKRWQDGHGVLNMVMKCAEAAVLREVFPETCSGLYLAEEVGKLRAEQRAKEATDREAAARARIRERHAAAQQADVPADEPTHETPDDGVVHDGIVLPRDDEPTRGEQAARLRERVQARATERAQAAADAPQSEPDAPNDTPAEEVRGGCRGDSRRTGRAAAVHSGGVHAVPARGDHRDGADPGSRPGGVHQAAARRPGGRRPEAPAEVRGDAAPDGDRRAAPSGPPRRGARLLRG
jgi:hypothetical protein